MQNHTIPHHFVMAALAGAERKQRSARSILHQAGLPTELIKEQGVRVTATQYARLIRTIWHELDDEFGGYGPAPSSPGSFAMMSLAIIHCTTLEQALRRASRFYGLFPDTPTFELQLEKEQAILTFDIDEQTDPLHYLTESLLVIWSRFGSWLIGRRIPLDSVELSYPAPEHQGEYRRLFSCPHHFSSTATRLRFPAQFLKLPILQDERTLKQFLQTSPSMLLAKPDYGNSITGVIRSRLGKDFSRPFPDFEQIADSLHLTPQTLRRRLRDEGTSYQEIKDNLRRDAAIYHLERNQLSINEIATEIGFSEPSTFHRAFKKWTGVTPGAYRNNEQTLTNPTLEHSNDSTP
ncbi:AraC family transcriptional regulator [Aestuariirhabdus sp. Z084]|uniref:AraC family transcriptional regulator n=1 Tax=Aestuariirhabdus haliotis TaxID=2918751 RepID=UPI00201B36DA|nr:AraC family transcriptional regulator [Aestuariirhabdus haliotis]MCL6415742.1 AraC family transcriptional regulator [Aestuariirhabdus haliotis]MCL6419659.1 AraC family transcriptional regulator [Aestuariirhabdus haliotis]